MFLAEPVYSVVDFSFYKRAVARSGWRALGYLVYLGLLFSLASTVSLYLKEGPIMDGLIDWAATSIPALTLADGKISSSVTAPTIVRNPKAPGLSVMIDLARTTPVTLEEMSKQRIMAYLTQSKIYMVTGPDRMQSYDLSRSPNSKPLVIDGNFYRTYGGVLLMILYPAAWLISWAGFICWKLLTALFYSLLGLLLNAILSGGLPYASLYKIAVYAQTPVILLQGLSLFITRQIPGFFLISILITGVYIWQAVRQNKLVSEQGAPS